MIYLVSKFNVRSRGGTVNGGHEFESSKDNVKEFFTSLETAEVAAELMASKTPGTQYAVFKPVSIREALAPEKPKLIVKTINENGEVVVSK